MLLSNASCITPGGWSLPQIFICYEQSLPKSRETFAQSQNINKLYIAAFFSAAKIKLEEKTQAKNTRIHVFLKAINLEFFFFF